MTKIPTRIRLQKLRNLIQYRDFSDNQLFDLAHEKVKSELTKKELERREKFRFEVMEALEDFIAIKVIVEVAKKGAVRLGR